MSAAENLKIVNEFLVRVNTESLEEQNRLLKKFVSENVTEFIKSYDEINNIYYQCIMILILLNPKKYSAYADYVAHGYATDPTKFNDDIFTRKILTERATFGVIKELNNKSCIHTIEKVKKLSTLKVDYKNVKIIKIDKK